MQKLKYILIATILTFSLNLHAVEPVLDHQAYFYFNLPFGSTNKSDNAYSFGFRLDRSLMKKGATIDLAANRNKPALFNFKMAKHGIQSFELNGIDFLADNYIYRGAEDGGKTSAKTESADPEAVETTEAPAQEEEKEHDKVTKAIVNAPMDVKVGVAFGVLIGAVAIGASGR